MEYPVGQRVWIIQRGPGRPGYTGSVFSAPPSHLLLPLRFPRSFAAVTVGLAAAGGVAWYLLTRTRISAEELERSRRTLLATTGRITDGSITDLTCPDLNHPDLPSPDLLNPDLLNPDLTGPDLNHLDLPHPALAQPKPAAPEEPARIPQVILYNYRIGGVSYECGQVVTALPDHVRGIRIDLPIQVRYDPHNPADSIVVAESWSGLRLTPTAPHRHDPDLP